MSAGQYSQMPMSLVNNPQTQQQQNPMFTNPIPAPYHTYPQHQPQQFFNHNVNPNQQLIGVPNNGTYQYSPFNLLHPPMDQHNYNNLLQSSTNGQQQQAEQMRVPEVRTVELNNNASINSIQQAGKAPPAKGGKPNSNANLHKKAVAFITALSQDGDGDENEDEDEIEKLRGNTSNAK